MIIDAHRRVRAEARTRGAHGGAARTLAAFVGLITTTLVSSPGRGAPDPEQAPARLAVHATVAEGKVESTDPAAGIVVLSNLEGRLLLRGRPHQVRALAPGSEVAVAYALYGPARWLLDDVHGRARAQSDHLLEGVVTMVDLPAGRIILRDNEGHTMVVSAHPLELQSIFPGHRLRVHYHSYGGRRWIERVEYARELALPPVPTASPSSEIAPR